MVSHLQESWQHLSQEGKDAFARGDYESGKALFKRALGKAHEDAAAETDMAEIFYAYGNCLVAAGDRGEGRQRLNQALHTFERSLGESSPQVYMVKASLAALSTETDPPWAIKVSTDPGTASPQLAPAPVAAAPQQAPANLIASVSPAPQTSVPQAPIPQPQAPQPQAPAQSQAPPAAAAPAAPANDSIKSLAKRVVRTGPKEAEPGYDEIMSGRQSKEPDSIFIDELIHPKEKIYGICTAAIGIWVYFLLTICLLGLALFPLALLAGYISAGIHLGHLRSRGIKVSDRQFPEVHALIDRYSTILNMQPPEVYVVQEHGLLNAFANRLHRKDMIVIYSDVMELAYAMGEKEMAFVVCHELAHIKRGHVKMAWLHMPGEIIPFLGSAYSRACEYTCDRVAAEIIPDGALFGLVCLAAGTKLYRHVNLKALYEQAEEEWGFWTWFSEIHSTHPNLNNRIRAIGLRDQAMRGYKNPAAGKAV